MKKLLSDAQEDEIRRLWKDGARQIDLARRYGVKKHVIARVVGNRWSGRSLIPSAGNVSSKVCDEGYARFKEEEKKLPPDTRSRWEQWMPRPGRSALDQKRAQEGWS